MGKTLLEKALQRGYEAKAFVRNPDKLGDLKEDVRVVQGSIFDPDKMSEAIQDADAVITAVGAPIKNAEAPERYRDAMADLVSAMKSNHVKRIIAVGGAGTRYEKERMGFKRSMLSIIVSLAGKHIVRAKRLEYAVLKNSGLDWTVVRPPQIADADGELIADQTHLKGFKVDTGQLADFMLDNIEKETWINKLPLVATIKKARTG